MAYQILLVEDDEATRKLLVRCLEQEGYAVMGVVDSETDIPLLGDAIELVITDYHLPGLNGVELIKHVRQQYPTIRTILMSGDLAVKYLARSCGAHDYYEKGTPLLGLLTSVAKLMPDKVG